MLPVDPVGDGGPLRGRIGGGVCAVQGQFLCVLGVGDPTWLKLVLVHTVGGDLDERVAEVVG
jgi:hypothetical protein